MQAPRHLEEETRTRAWATRREGDVELLHRVWLACRGQCHPTHWWQQHDCLPIPGVTSCRWGASLSLPPASCLSPQVVPLLNKARAVWVTAGSLRWHVPSTTTTRDGWVSILPTFCITAECRVSSRRMHTSWSQASRRRKQLSSMSVWEGLGGLLPLLTQKYLQQKYLRKYSSEGLMLKLKCQYLGHLMQRANPLEETLMGKIEGRKKRG